MKLNHKFSIYIPSTVNVNTAVDNSQEVKNALRFLSSLFGGATALRASGAWVSDSAGLVLEEVTICYAFCTLWNKWKYRRAVKNYCKRLGMDMLQDAISLEIDDRLRFVK